MAPLFSGLHEESGDRISHVPSFGSNLAQSCNHPAVPSLIEPDFKQAIVDGLDARNLRARCSTCSRDVIVRLWRPHSGEWYLRFREQLAAGRMWIFRYMDEKWVADGYR